MAFERRNVQICVVQLIQLLLDFLLHRAQPNLLLVEQGVEFVLGLGLVHFDDFVQFEEMVVQFLLHDLLVAFLHPINVF